MNPDRRVPSEERNNRAITPTEKPSRKERVKSEPNGRIDAEFLKTLEEFPEEVQAVFYKMDPRLRSMILEGRHKAVQQTEQSEQYVDTFLGPLKMGTKEELEAFFNEIRHERGQWKKEEVDEMDPVKRELLLFEMLNRYLSSVDLRKRGEVTGTKLHDVMDLIWGSRDKEGDAIGSYQGPRISDYEEKRFKPLLAHDALMEELQGLGERRGLNKGKRLRRAEILKELVEKYDDWVDKKGDHRESYHWESERDHLKFLEEETKKCKQHEAYLLQSIAYLIAYLDPAEFAVVFQESAELMFNWIRQWDSEVRDAIMQASDAWYKGHDQETALKNPGPPIVFSEKKKRLTTHMWNLFNSYLRIKRDFLPSPTPEEKRERMVNTARELTVALYLLQIQSRK